MAYSLCEQGDCYPPSNKVPSFNQWHLSLQFGYLICVSWRMYKNGTINRKAWLVLMLAVALLGLLFSYRDLALGFNHRTTSGTITELLPNNHLGFRFRYEMDGHTYEDVSFSGEIDRTFSTIKIGDQVTVFYNPSHPSSHTLEVPSVLLVRTFGTIIAACAILPIIFTLVWLRNPLIRDQNQPHPDQ